MATVISASTLSISETKYNVQNAGEAWSLVQLDSDTFRFEVRKGDNWIVDPESKNRSELSMRTTIDDGTIINVGYKMTVEPGAVNTAGFTVLGQFHQDQNNSDSGKAPPFAIGLVGERMVVTIAYRDATGKDVVETIFTDGANIARGHEYSFSVKAEFDPDGIGHLVVLRDGVKIADYAGPLGWPNQTGVYWKEGIYRGAADETLAVTYSGLSVGTSGLAPSTSPGSSSGSDGPITYYQYGGDGKVVAEVTTQPDGARTVQSFDAAGKLAKLTETATSGAWSVTTYGITGKSFQTETISYDASGKVVSMVGRHTDGSLDYQQIRVGDGSIENWTYDAAGALVKEEVVKAGGGRDVYEYAFADKSVVSTHRAYDTAGTLRLSEQKYANGNLDYVTVWNQDGSKLGTDYNTSGAVVSTTLTLANGSRVVNEFGITGRTYVSATSSYDASGALISTERQHADGSLDYSYVKSASGTTVKFYDTKGLLTKVEATSSDGHRDVFEYAFASKDTPSTHRIYDAGGNLTLLETYSSAGTLASARSYNGDGTSLLKEYGASGVLVTQTLTLSDGSRQVDQYNITGQSYTSTTTHYDKAGKLDTLTRYHADGTKEYAIEANAAGTTSFFYGATGALTKKEVVTTAGARDIYEYGFADKSVASLHRGYDKSGLLVTYEQKNANGTLDLVKTYKADGSSSTFDYDSRGTLISSTVVNADKSSDVGQYNITGKSYTSTTTHYDKAGKLETLSRYHADGTKEYAIVANAAGTTSFFYGATGALTKKEVVTTATGAKDVYEYAFADKSVASLHRGYDKSGLLVIYEQKNANGTLDLVKTYKADGSSSTLDYDSRGTLISSTVVNADKSSDVGQYNITGKSYTSTTTHYDKAGKLETLTRYHADGTKEYAIEANAAGTTSYFYSAAGALTKKEVVTTATGAKDVYEYAFADKSVASLHRGYDKSGLLVTYEQKNANGTLDLVKTYKADGSSSTFDYDSRGTLISSTVVNADKSSDVGQYNITGKSYTSTTTHYDKAGKLETLSRYHADGTKEYAIVANAAGTTSFFYGATGALTKKEVVTTATGAKDVYEYAFADKSVASIERSYDGSNNLLSWASADAAGNKSMAAYAHDVTLKSGAGNDVMSSFGGDTFVFKGAFGQDTVRNFHAGAASDHDTIVFDLTVAKSFADLAMQQVGNDVVISIADHGTVTLDHVAMRDLHAGDFLFL